MECHSQVRSLNPSPFGSIIILQRPQLDQFQAGVREREPVFCDEDRRYRSATDTTGTASLISPVLILSALLGETAL